MTSKYYKGIRLLYKPLTVLFTFLIPEALTTNTHTEGLWAPRLTSVTKAKRFQKGKLVVVDSIPLMWGLMRMGKHNACLCQRWIELFHVGMAAARGCHSALSTGLFYARHCARLWKSAENNWELRRREKESGWWDRS